jgi:hypothetical protein
MTEAHRPVTREASRGIEPMSRDLGARRIVVLVGGDLRYSIECSECGESSRTFANEREAFEYAERHDQTCPALRAARREPPECREPE